VNEKAREPSAWQTRLCLAAVSLPEFEFGFTSFVDVASLAVERRDAWHDGNHIDCSVYEAECFGTAVSFLTGRWSVVLLWMLDKVMQGRKKRKQVLLTFFSDNYFAQTLAPEPA